jgi:hypothetical protein
MTNQPCSIAVVPPPVDCLASRWPENQHNLDVGNSSENAMRHLRPDGPETLFSQRYRPAAAFIRISRERQIPFRVIKSENAAGKLENWTPAPSRKL